MDRKKRRKKERGKNKKEHSCVCVYIYRRGYRYLVWVSAAKISRLLGSKRFGWVKILANRRSFSSISCIREIYFRAKNDGPEVTAEGEGGREKGKFDEIYLYVRFSIYLRGV